MLAHGLQLQDVTRYINIHELRPLFRASPIATSTTQRLAALFRPATCTFHPQRQDANGLTLYGPSLAQAQPQPTTAIALLCVARDGVQGGLHVFDDKHQPPQRSIVREPYPGHLLLYDPTLFTHTTTPLLLPTGNYGYQDILVIHCSNTLSSAIVE